ncbi:hypothetical protein PsYK624_002790 [Phanerochaete sordida]|uniref:Uncharacterized protein n=1 Tax=Phanerochaete sordida TaxID=48140 RepID=A0A9P3FX54_9APHY|nr:hypothetical protein PsYK624_002790 [Phanerochaete sordida]
MRELAIVPSTSSLLCRGPESTSGRPGPSHSAGRARHSPARSYRPSDARRPTHRGCTTGMPGPAGIRESVYIAQAAGPPSWA